MRHGDDPMRFAKTLATERSTRGVDRTGWIVSLSDGSNIGPFRKPKDAWNWVNRQPSRRYKVATMRTASFFTAAESMPSRLTRPIRNSRTAKITRITRQHHSRPERFRRDHSGDVASENTSLLICKEVE
jgi:hypothetical protein